MKKRLFISLLLSLAFLTPSYGEQRPKSLPKDTRIKKYVYEEDNVYKLDLFMKSITTVQFAQGESIQSILIGDSASWEVIRLQSGNVLSIKPTIIRAASNMTVYTNERVYTFSLRALSPSQAAKGQKTYRTKFTYPNEVHLAKLAKAKKAKAFKNSNYYFAGLGKLRPIRVYDNGKQTHFTFPENTPKPAIFTVGKRGKESLVNSRTRGNTIIVDSVSPLWTVRIGDEELCIASQAGLPNAPPPHHKSPHTQSPVPTPIQTPKGSRYYAK